MGEAMRHRRGAQNRCRSASNGGYGWAKGACRHAGGGAPRSGGNGAESVGGGLDVVAVWPRDGSGWAAFASRMGGDGLGVAHRCAGGVGRCSRGSGAGGSTRSDAVVIGRREGFGASFDVDRDGGAVEGCLSTRRGCGLLFRRVVGQGGLDALGRRGYWPSRGFRGVV